jgi:hypothetical protein
MKLRLIATGLAAGLAMLGTAQAAVPADQAEKIGRAHV